LLLTAAILKVGRTGQVLHTREVVRLPAGPDEVSWRRYHLWSFLPPPGTDVPQPAPAGPGRRWSDLWLRFRPALVTVAAGQLNFVGVPPRSPEEIDALPRDWRALYLRAKAGIITEAMILYGDSPTEDERYAAEAYYTAQEGWRLDFRLLL